MTTQKYMPTPRGIFELKYFFGSHVATETGGAASAHRDPRADQAAGRAPRTRKAPLSDAASPRSSASRASWSRAAPIAKYRESLQILPVNLRKALCESEGGPHEPATSAAISSTITPAIRELRRRPSSSASPAISTT